MSDHKKVLESVVSNKEALAAEVREDEGLKLTTYPGPKTGKPHIGYGHLLGQEQHEEELQVMGLEDELDDWTGFTITEETAEKLLQIDIEDAEESLHPTKRYPGWTEEELEALDSKRYIALMSMAFQLGGYGVRSKFPSFVTAVKEEDWDRAADEMLWSNGLKKERRSQWYKDTPDRCQAMSDLMRHGSETESDIVEQVGQVSLENFTDAELIAELNKRLVKGL